MACAGCNQRLSDVDAGRREPTHHEREYLSRPWYQRAGIDGRCPETCTSVTHANHRAVAAGEQPITFGPPSHIRIEWDGQLVFTSTQAAHHYGLTTAGMRSTIKRLGVHPIPETIDDRTPLYLASELDRVMKARPRPRVGGRPRRGVDTARPNATVTFADRLHHA